MIEMKLQSNRTHMKPNFLIVAGLLLALGMFSTSAEDAAKRYEVDPVASSIKWHGAKVGTDHYGKVKLKSGWLTVAGGRITGGEFVADMNSISNNDLSTKKGFFGGESDNQKLVDHLKSADFFNVKKFPESKFVITKVETKADGTYQLTGDMTIRGISMSLGFAATVKIDGDTLRGTAKPAFDRAQHNVKFHSGTIAQLGDKLIEDNVPLEVELVAKTK